MDPATNVAWPCPRCDRRMLVAQGDVFRCVWCDWRDSRLSVASRVLRSIARVGEASTASAYRDLDDRIRRCAGSGGR